jgi:hypothetical protein
MTIFGAFFMCETWFKQHQFFAIVFIALLLFFFFGVINTFFKVATVFATQDYCDKNKASILSACGRSLGRIGLIIPWGFSEGLIRMAAGKQEKSSGSSAGSLILGTSWQYLSFFIYPIIAFEKVGFFGSMKRSVELTKKYFGTLTGSLITFSIAQWLVIALILGILVSVMYLIGTAFTWLMVHTGNPMTEKTFMAVFVIPFTVWALFTGIQFVLTARAIMSTLIYRHIHGQSTGFLAPATLQAALKEI